ncbi:MAG: hypothetical protein EBS30_19150 [Planctomycetes bacterium]|nr:hypothetical protein [Planctomycetota bacterium]
MILGVKRCYFSADSTAQEHFQLFIHLGGLKQAAERSGLSEACILDHHQSLMAFVPCSMWIVVSVLIISAPSLQEHREVWARK